jgi:uncharacterized membrane protein YdjX (TVP38/TMEM64 family)
MRDLYKPLVIVALALAVPILPFVLAGEWFEEAFARGVRRVDEAGLLFAAIVAVLAVDVFLPVPSSGVGTLAGAQLGTALGTVATWLGLTAGAVVGFAVARRWGKPLAERLAGREELARLEAPAHRFGAWLVLVSRPVPIVAEASVLLLGATRLSWRAFWWPLAIANLVLAVCYAALGDVARRYEWLATAVFLALVVPLVVAWWIRKFQPFNQ